MLSAHECAKIRSESILKPHKSNSEQRQEVLEDGDKQASSLAFLAVVLLLPRDGSFSYSLASARGNSTTANVQNPFSIQTGLQTGFADIDRIHAVGMHNCSFQTKHKCVLLAVVARSGLGYHGDRGSTRALHSYRLEACTVMLCCKTIGFPKVWLAHRVGRSTACLKHARGIPQNYVPNLTSKLQTGNIPQNIDISPRTLFSGSSYMLCARVCANAHACMHTYIPTYIHTYIHVERERGILVYIAGRCPFLCRFRYRHRYRYR